MNASTALQQNWLQQFPCCSQSESPVSSHRMPYLSFPLQECTHLIHTRNMERLKRPIHSQLNWAILLCDVIPDGQTK